MKNTIYTLLCSILLTSAFGQTVNKGVPTGWKGKLRLNNIPAQTMPGFDIDVVKAEDEINDLIKSIPWRFGYKYNTSFSLQNSGTWKTLPNGDRVWQLQINCPSALTVNLLFENFYLPEGAFMYLYDVAQTNKVGAYTRRNNRNDQLLGSELVHGEEIIVELYEPKSVKNQSSFTISNVIHGYRSLTHIQNQLEKALNGSGSCNIDVNCPLGNSWDSQIRSVAMIVTGGSGICTGALINNTCNDGTPYFLTANHCVGGSTGNWAFRFNWESPAGTESCANNNPSSDPGPPYDQTANGATVLANNSSSDFALLEIDNMTLADAQNWNCFYAGWDNTDNETVTQATGIHHPSGDVKKICQENNAPYHDNASGAAVWMIDDWDQGVTEPGSSGSPLFDQNKRIIGQLYGGGAACSGTTDNGQPDYYGRFGVSWNNGVSNYLAASCGTATTNDGYDPNASTVNFDAGIQSITNPSDNSTLCNNNVGPTVILKNYGMDPLTSVTIAYDIDGGVPEIYNWSGNLSSGATETVTLGSIQLTSGNHTLNVTTASPNGNTDQNTSNDDASVSFDAITNGVTSTLSLTLDCFGEEVDWEVRDNNNILLYSGGPYNNDNGGTVISEDFCLVEDQCYDFIINDSWGDGMNGSADNNCNVDGDYEIIDFSGSILAEMQAPDGDYDNQEVNNFCVGESNAGIQENSFHYNIYPNPTHQVLNIKYANTYGKLNVQIIDISGKIVLAQTQINTTATINVQQLSSGYYTIRLYNEKVNTTEKLIKK